MASSIEAHLPQPVPGHQLLGLRERPVDDGPLLAVESKALALRARVKAAIPANDPALTSSSLNFWNSAISSGVGGVAALT